jgi:hypothetical protein
MSHLQSQEPILVHRIATEKVNKWTNEAIDALTTTRDRMLARSFIRAALAMLGEGVDRLDISHEREIAGSLVEDSDFSDLIENAKGLSRKVHESLEEGEVLIAVRYLKTIYHLWGDGGEGSLTPRPRDYAAAMSRFSDESLSSPGQERLPSQIQHLEHHHPSKSDHH